LSEDIVPYEEKRPTALLPKLDPLEAKEAYEAYLKLCQSILVPYEKRVVRNGVVVQESDYARIPTRRQVEGQWVTEYVDAPKKSAWRKLARFYGVTTHVVKEERLVGEDGSVTYHFTVRASVDDLSTDGVGSCCTSEKGGRTEHEARATAYTRAANRAIADLVGFGQVSAEELEPSEPRPGPARRATSPMARPPANAKKVESQAKVLTPDKVEIPVYWNQQEVSDWFSIYGLDPNSIEVKEGDPGEVVLKPKRFIDHPNFRVLMQAAGAQYDPQRKAYLVRV